MFKRLLHLTLSALIFSVPALQATQDNDQNTHASQIKETGRVERLVSYAKKNPKNTTARAIVVLTLGLGLKYRHDVFNASFSSGESSLNASADIADSTCMHIDRDSGKFNDSISLSGLGVMAAAGFGLYKLWNIGKPAQQSATKKPSFYSKIIDMAKKHPYKFAALIGSLVFAAGKYSSMDRALQDCFREGYAGWIKNPLTLLEAPLVFDSEIDAKAQANRMGILLSVTTCACVLSLLNDARKSLL